MNYPTLFFFESCRTDAEPSATATTETQFMEVQRIIPSRMGHSLLLDKKRDCLWVLTGERDQHYYSDIWRYNFRNCQADLVDADYTHAGRHLQTSDMLKLSVAAPEAGFSQRTTFDSEADEWHMFCGLCRDRGSGEVTSKPNAKNEMMSSEFWRYSVKEGRWTKAIMKPQVDGAETPPPRFAHQVQSCACFFTNQTAKNTAYFVVNQFFRWFLTI